MFNQLEPRLNTKIASIVNKQIYKLENGIKNTINTFNLPNYVKGNTAK